MRAPLRLRILGLAFALLAAAFLAPSAPAAPPADLVPDRILVGFAGLPADPAAFAASIGASVRGGIPELGVLILDVDPEAADLSIAAALATPGVLFAEHDKVRRATLTPNDVLYSQQYAPAKVKLPAAWDRTLGSHNRMIAIIDTGIDRAHADLALNVCHLGAAFLSSTGTGVPGATEDDNGHGTHVSGIAAAMTNNVEGVAGAGQSCLMPVKVLNAGGLGFTSDVAAGIVYAANNGANVLSMSLGSDSSDSAEKAAVDYAVGKGALVVAAAGNDGCGKRSNVGYPAAYPNAIAVSSTDRNNKLSSFSSCGSEVDIAAPGSSILSTFTGNSYLILSGTSMSTPLVSGVAALAWSCNPGASAASVRQALESNADSIGLPGSQQGRGLLDAAGTAVSLGC